MLGNYKKIAIIDLNIVCPKSEGHFNTRIATNLNFTPTMVFVIMNNGLRNNENVFGPTIGRKYDGYSLGGTIKSITKDYVDVDIFIEYPYHDGKTKVKQLVAIG